MAKLTTKQRNALSKSAFALPDEEKYPVYDRAHAANAKARATQMYNKGKLSASKRAQVFAAANKELGKSKKKG